MTPPAWTISILSICLGTLLYMRARAERNMLLYGKIGTLMIIALIYALFDTSYFNILTARALSRWSWILYFLAEISYHVTRYYVDIKKWIGIAFLRLS